MFTHNYIGENPLFDQLDSYFQRVRSKKMLILGISSISRFGENKIYEMTVKKIFDQPGKICKKRFHYFA